MNSPPSMNLSVRQLRAFATIARVRSFTRAGEQLHITQSGLSGMVREIEQQLDCRLFERTTRAVALTPHGQAFLPVATRVLQELDAAAASLGQLSSLERRRLVVGATPAVASSILPAVCTEFAGRFPGVQIDVHDLDRTEIRARVMDGTVDAGFGVFLDPASGLRRLPLLKTPLVLVTPGQAARAKAVRWADLGSARLLALPAGNPIQQLVNAHLPEGDATQAAASTFNLLHTLLAMVEAGAGEAVLPSFVSAAAARYRVVLRPIVQPRVDVDFYEITRSGRPRSALVTAFGEALVRMMKVPRPRTPSA